MKKILAVISFATALVGCGEEHPHSRYHTHQYTITHDKVEEREYQIHNSDPNFPWLYYYILFVPNSNTYYYYSSPKEVANFSSIIFTKSVGSLPKEVEQELEVAKEVGEEHDLAADEEPIEVAQDTTESQMSDMNSEGGISATESSTSESTSSDSGGGGGSDSGGGGGSD